MNNNNNNRNNIGQGNGQGQQRNRNRGPQQQRQQQASKSVMIMQLLDKIGLGCDAGKITFYVKNGQVDRWEATESGRVEDLEEVSEWTDEAEY